MVGFFFVWRFCFALMVVSDDGLRPNPTLYYSLHAVRDIANGIDRCQNLGRHIKTG